MQIAIKNNDYNNKVGQFDHKNKSHRIMIIIIIRISKTLALLVVWEKDKKKRTIFFGLRPLAIL